jgi:cytidylate kinase
MSETTNFTFKDAVYEWMRLNEDISELQKEIRAKKNKMNARSQFIMTFMKEQDKEMCNVGASNALVLKKRKVTTSINKVAIMEALKKITSDQQATETTNSIFDSRPVKFKEYIHLTNT